MAGGGGKRAHVAYLVAFASFPGDHRREEFETTTAERGVAFGLTPKFEGQMENITTPAGRDVTLNCRIHYLGGHRVGWVKKDTRALQAVSLDIITSNPRVWVSHLDVLTWSLHIKNVQKEDSGRYMCQINTNPMMVQEAYLNILLPPDFIAENTSSDVIVPEESTAQLTCKAKGDPDPTITWRREDTSDIILRETGGMKYSARAYVGDVLTLPKVTRQDMGMYLCIATNGVPPSISKRILLATTFAPTIKVPNQLIGAPRWSNVSIECLVEAYPRSINVWVKDTGKMLVESPKYAVQEIAQSMYVMKMVLTVRDFQKDDVGTYICLAKSSRGETEEIIRLYEIPGPKRKLSPPRYDQNEITASRDGGSHPADKGERVIDDNDEQQQHQHKGNSVEDVIDAGKDAIHHDLSVDHPKSVVAGGGGGGGGGGGAAGKPHLPTTVRNAPDGLGHENTVNPSRHDTISSASTMFMEFLYITLLSHIILLLMVLFW
ncbi:lachesin-like [Anopheles bellator]|uniref:lachesin-like n=1 Tax=Anopheles bellator TaxID=139047 RepID=UPI00264A45C0|nr:lachesin-like [Anopheles bellator]